MRKVLLGCLLFMFIFILIACGNQSDVNNTANSNEEEGKLSDPVNFSWASGPQGGVWYSAAGGISTMLKETNNNLNLKAIPGGSVQNIGYLENKEAEIAWNYIFFAEHAMNGSGPFDEVHENLSAIGNGYGKNYFHFVINADNEYESIDEIFKKGNIKMAVLPPSNSDDFIFRTIMDFYDTSYEKLEEKGVTFFQGSYDEQAEQFQNENVDVFFAGGGIPSSPITNASVNRDAKILPFPDDLIEYLETKAFVEDEIPADTYPNAMNGDEAIKSVSAPNTIIASKDAPENAIYEITKAIYENANDFGTIHASLGSYEEDNVIDSLGEVELHPGAAKFYKEIGLLK